MYEIDFSRIVIPVPSWIVAAHRLGWVFVFVVSAAAQVGAQSLARGIARTDPVIGRVVGTDGRAVAGATVDGLGLVAAARTDAAGRFRARTSRGLPVTLRVRAFGFAPRQYALAADRDSLQSVEFVLLPTASMLSAVVTTGTMQERYVSDSPVKVDVVTPTFLRRSVSNNLMDNVSFLPGLTQQVDCGVCFTNNIRINGMDGPYTAVLIDGAPMISALATVYGLNSIDPTLIEQIEIIKGPNSTLYGSEAMGGVINVVTKDARLAPRLSLNTFVTSDGETSLAAARAQNVGRASTLLSVTGAWNARFVDRNGDSFSDLPLVKRLSVMNKWSIGTAAARPFDLMVRYYGEDRFGGVRGWTAADRGSSVTYGESIRTHRVEVITSYRGGSAALPLRVDGAFNWHDQDSFYGDRPYRARQTIGFVQGLLSPQLGAHALVVGATMRQQWYRDTTSAQQTNEVRFIPGVFAQDEWALRPAFTLLGGLRVDHHQLHGVIASPRLALKWAPDPHTTVRVSAATGFRVVSLFSEDHAALTGARRVTIAERLNPERSATVTAGLNRVVDVRGVEDALTLDVDAFLTRFSNRIVGDFDTDPNQIIYRNLRGYAMTRGVSLAVGYSTLRSPFFGSVGLTAQDVFIRERGIRRALPFAPTMQGVFTLGYRIAPLGLSVDWTGRVQGPASLPRFAGLPSRSTWFTEQHLQFAERVGRSSEIYVGVKNLFNYVQRDPIIDPQHPFGDDFDTARVFGPLQGRRVLLGMRSTVSR